MKRGITIFRGFLYLFLGLIVFDALGQTQDRNWWFINDGMMGGECPFIGDWEGSTDTCTLHKDVVKAIKIVSDGVTLDGAGHSVQGTTEAGISIVGIDGPLSDVTVKNVIVTGFVNGIFIDLQSSNNTLHGNTLIDNNYGIYISNSNSNNVFENILAHNGNGIFIFGTSYNNKIYNNFFHFNSVQAESNGISLNDFNEPHPIGGNYWSDWTIDFDSDGFADSPYNFTGGVDNLPRIIQFNLPPLIHPTAPIKVQEYDLVEFTLYVYDLNGDDFELSAEGVPEEAYFDAVNGVFTWIPVYDQEGVFVVTFYATDNGFPSETGQLDVTITVIDIPPTELNDEIIDTFTNDMVLPKEIDKSYLANLLKVNVFIENGMITPAINQLNAFINKVNGDIAEGILDSSEGQRLIEMASDIISKLSQ